MKQKIMKFAKSIAPPVAVDIYRRFSGCRWFCGHYKTWDEARKASEGYDSDVILNKVKNSLLKVKKGEAVYERDSVLFGQIHYSWPLLAGLLWVASCGGNRLNLIDFGGSLGSSYYQNKKFLEHLPELKWSIVEQEKFVECGKEYFEDEHLKFYNDIDKCIVERRPNAILFSSVIQYLEKPYGLLANVLNQGFVYILFDRTSFLEKGNDRITVQKVPPEIYPASYPAWFFNLDKFLDFFADQYELMAEFDSFETFPLGDVSAQNKGFIFRRRT
jgi:putative methyltransferase (TIGR04325 family)